MTALLNGICQGWLLVAFVWLLLKIVPRLNAATRYAVWVVTLLIAVILPLWQMTGESRSQKYVAQKDQPILMMPTAPVPDSMQIPHHAAQNNWTSTATISTEQNPRHWLPIALPAGWITCGVLSVWTATSTLLLLRLILSYRAMQQLKARAAEAEQPLQNRVKILSQKAGVLRRTRLLVSEDVRTPMAIGLLRSAILIPQLVSQQMSDVDFDHVMLHELAHLQRYDDWVNLFQKILEVILPIQPAVFWIDRQLTLERETACDDWVVAHVGTAKPYAASLTRIAELTLWARCGMLASGAIGRPSQLFRRVHRLLDKKRNATPRILGVRLTLSVSGLMLMAWIVASAPQLVALADSPGTLNSNNHVTFPPATPHEPSLPMISGSTDPTSIDLPGTLIRSFTTRPGDKLVVDVDRDNVLLTGGDGDTARIVVSENGTDADGFWKTHPIEITHTGHEIRVTARWSSPSESDSKIMVTYNIVVPRELNAEISDRSGNIAVAMMHGAIHIAADAGNIAAQGCTGRLDLDAERGNITLRDIQAPVQSHAAAGNIDAIACHDLLQLNVEDGNIRAADCTGALQAKGASGRIDVPHFNGPAITAEMQAGNVSAELLSSLKTDSVLKTSMGNVHVTLGKSAGVNLSVSNQTGRVDSDFPLGPVHGGGASLRLETQMGNIRVQQ